MRSRAELQEREGVGGCLQSRSGWERGAAGQAGRRGRASERARSAGKERKRKRLRPRGSRTSARRPSSSRTSTRFQAEIHDKKPSCSVHVVPAMRQSGSTADNADLCAALTLRTRAGISVIPAIYLRALGAIPVTDLACSAPRTEVCATSEVGDDAGKGKANKGKTGKRAR
eukprot:2664860-Rhodomonas_salina.1